MSLSTKKAVALQNAPVHLVESTLAAMQASTQTPAATNDDFEFTPEQEVQLWTQVQPYFDQLKQLPEKSIMWVPEIIQTAAWMAGAAISVAAANAPAMAANPYVVGICRESRPSMGVEIRPTYAASSYAYKYHRNNPKFKGVNFKDTENGDIPKVTILTKPKHGAVELVDKEYGSDTRNWYHYWPEEGYIGKDRFVMQVEKNGIKIRIYYVIEGLSDEEPTTIMGRALYCVPESWKISLAPETDTGTSNLTTWQTQSHLSALLAAASGVHTELADLPGAALGLHEGGSGWNARITLDSNAAGHGWYVDATPWSVSDDYLPTSDPNLWLAKPGSGAEGKMDLLSVWLHELGHAAGLDHTASGAGLMGATLLPGQRLCAGMSLLPPPLGEG
jgi:hypothetical protein